MVTLVQVADKVQIVGNILFHRFPNITATGKAIFK
jgi:hypothetical protein